MSWRRKAWPVLGLRQRSPSTQWTPCSLSDIAHLDHLEGDVLSGLLHHLQLWVEIHTSRTPKRLITPWNDCDYNQGAKNSTSTLGYLRRVLWRKIFSAWTCSKGVHPIGFCWVCWGKLQSWLSIALSPAMSVSNENWSLRFKNSQGHLTLLT